MLAMRKKGLVLSAVIVVFLFVLSPVIAPEAGAAYPEPGKTIRMIVPFPPGGNTDIVARAIANELSKNLGVPLVIDNRGGFGLLAPAKTPRDIIMKLNAEAVKVVAMPEVRKRLANEGADPVGSTPEEYDAYIRSDIEKWIKVVEKAGIKPE
jgi:tripartite-type tricarboxylate transporter receptor subunit TctC